jgi:CHAD domain-containing protein
VLRRQFEQMLKNECGTRSGDPDALHDMRVASLRVRAAMRAFRDALPARRVARFDRDLRWIRDALGKVRDLDVYLTHLASWMTNAPPRSRDALGPYLDQLHARRRRARAAMLRSLGARRYSRFVESFRLFLEAGPAQPPSVRSAGRPVEEAAQRIIMRRRQKALGTGRAIGCQSTDAQLHKLRIRCKRLRYACEFFEDVLGPPATEFIARVKRLQDALGENQDSVVARERLTEFAGSVPAHRDPGGSLRAAVGCLLAAHEERSRRARASFFQQWQEFDSPAVRGPLLLSLGVPE